MSGSGTRASGTRASGTRASGTSGSGSSGSGTRAVREDGLEASGSRASGGRTGRRPGDQDTRGSILQSARKLFAERGYEQTTIRAVAGDAGVDPALLHHYFGTKAGLFAAVGRMPYDLEALFAGLADRPHEAGREIAHRVLSIQEANPEARATLIGLMRAAGSQPQAAEALRDFLGDALLSHLQPIVDHESMQMRASLIATQILGVGLGRYILQLPGVADLPADELAAAVGPALQHYVTGDIGTWSGEPAC